MKKDCGFRKSSVGVATDKFNTKSERVGE